MIKKELKQKANTLEVSVRIGKQGLTETVISEVDKLLKKRKLIKVKFLKSVVESKDKNELFLELAKKTKSELIEHVGFTVVLYRG